MNSLNSIILEGNIAGIEYYTENPYHCYYIDLDTSSGIFKVFFKSIDQKSMFIGNTARIVGWVMVDQLGVCVIAQNLDLKTMTTNFSKHKPIKIRGRQQPEFDF